LLDRLLAEGWLRRNQADRALQITASGAAALPRVFGVKLDGYSRAREGRV
jgi:hypothetical protein